MYPTELSSVPMVPGTSLYIHFLVLLSFRSDLSLVMPQETDHCFESSDHIHPEKVVKEVAVRRKLQEMEEVKRRLGLVFILDPNPS